MILQGQHCVDFMFYFQTSNAHQLTRSLDLILLNLKDLIGRPVIWNVLDVSNVAPSGESISRTSPSSQNTRRVDFFWKADQQRTFIKLLKQIYHLTHILLDIEAKGGGSVKHVFTVHLLQRKIIWTDLWYCNVSNLLEIDDKSILEREQKMEKIYKQLTKDDGDHWICLTAEGVSINPMGS